ncbi:competence type IV pilus minor pilin ComGE [Streptococcus mitis]|uniref:Type II secretory pathway pseudopilin n=1 Tax=Streptococcus mitis TaxID=28037 RepID=A0A428CDP2_STRMT|nr:competence type IV pilus minor pilin ComGE [Streptococcus mitis]RSI76042.1 Type II secretory pathway pseudopilin [Streptococcus mitis]
MEKLNALRKQKIKAVILLEAVVALAVFASIATLLLGQIQQNRRLETEILQKEEVLRVAKMALQTGQNQVKVNGVDIQVFASEKGLEVYHGSEKLLDLKEQ